MRLKNNLQRCYNEAILIIDKLCKKKYTSSIKDNDT